VHLQLARAGKVAIYVTFLSKTCQRPTATKGKEPWSASTPYVDLA
jgi:hypothetical protein